MIKLKNLVEKNFKKKNNLKKLKNNYFKKR